MPNDSVRGAEDFLALSKRLKAAGQTELRKELNKTLKQAAKPLAAAAKQSAAENLPQHGGLAKVVAKRGARVKVSTGAATAGVSVVFAKTDPRLDKGRVVHPVFGRGPKVVQRIPSGFFTKPMLLGGKDVQRDVIAALGRFADRVARG